MKAVKKVTVKCSECGTTWCRKTDDIRLPRHYAYNFNYMEFLCGSWKQKCEFGEVIVI